MSLKSFYKAQGSLLLLILAKPKKQTYTEQVCEKSSFSSPLIGADVAGLMYPLPRCLFTTVLRLQASCSDSD